MPLSRDEFVQQLEASGLLSDESLRECLAQYLADTRSADGEALARELVLQKRLTNYQAERICAGHGAQLMLGNYIVLDLLGQGGMGVVLKGMHVWMERIVAIKVMSSEGRRSKEVVHRFQREVRTAGKLSHPNIVATLDSGEANGSQFLVMELVEGIDLSAFVKRHGPLPMELAVQCVIEAARGLEYAHSQGVVHRDIKPSNLLVSRKQRDESREGKDLSGCQLSTLDSHFSIKILDMGLARVDGVAGAGGTLTKSGAVLGTVDYMSPEQSMDTKHVDARSDIYSLGCTLFFLLTGKVLYDGYSITEKVEGHRKSAIPSLQSVTRGDDASRVIKPGMSLDDPLSGAVDSQSRRLSPNQQAMLVAVDKVYQRMVAKQPENRPQSMSEVVVELERCLAERGSSFVLRSGDRGAPGETDSENKLQEFLHHIREESELARSRTVLPISTRTITAPSAGDAEPMITVGTGIDSRTHNSLPGDSTKTGFGVGDMTVAFRSENRRWIGERSTTSGRKSFVLAVIVVTAVTVTVIGWMVWKARHKNDTSIAVKPSTGPNNNERPVSAKNDVETPNKTAQQPKSLAATAGMSRLIPEPTWPFDPQDGREYIWSKPENLGSAVNSAWYDEFPRLTPDGLTLWFSGGGEIWTSRRSALDAPWQPRVNAGSEFNDPASWDSEPCLSADGLTLIFSSERDTADPKQSDLWICTRADVTRPFGKPTRIQELHASEWDISPTLSTDGLTLYFGSYRKGTLGDLDIFQTTRPNTSSSFGDVKNLGPTINTPLREGGCFLSAHGLVLLLESGRPDGAGKIDLYMTARATSDEEFDKPISLGPTINSPHNDQGPCLSHDGLTLMFYSDRPGGFGQADIWMSRRVLKSAE